MEPLAKNWAEAIYDVLVREAGAHGHPDEKASFVYSHMDKEFPCTEYRFQGKLGFGGKFKRNWHHNVERWFVDCYAEDATPERKAIISRTNRALARLNAAYACTCPYTEGRPNAYDLGHETGCPAGHVIRIIECGEARQCA